MKKSMIFGIVLGAVAVMMMSLAAFAQGQGGPGRMGGGQGMRGQGMRGFGYAEVIAELELTDTQKEKMNEICKAHLEKVRPIRQQIMKKRQELVKALFADQPNKIQIANLRKEHDAMQARVAGICAEDLSKISGVLTPDQSAKLLKALLNPRMNRPMGPRYGGPGMGGGQMGGGREGVPPPPPGGPNEGTVRGPAEPMLPDQISAGLTDMMNM
ncbi:MAG TPA: periplasmic heavy metal sensor [Armatimonadota bacterium]|jgi:Spy/CpxP family protein refolding chaperone